MTPIKDKTRRLHMSLSVSIDGHANIQKDSIEDGRITMASGILIKNNGGSVKKTDCVIAVFSDSPMMTRCKCMVLDHGLLVGSASGTGFGMKQKSRACRALGRALEKCGVHVSGTPSLFYRSAGFVSMKSAIREILKSLRRDGEFCSATVY